MIVALALAFASAPATPGRSSIGSSPAASSAAAASRVPGSLDSRLTGELRLASTSTSVVRSARRCLAPKGGSSSTLTIPTRRSSAFENGADDLFFLDGSEIIDHRLAGKLTLGPAVYFVSTAAMVHRRRALPALKRSRRQVDLLLPGLERPPALGGMGGGPSSDLRSHGLHGIRRTLRRLQRPDLRRSSRRESGSGGRQAQRGRSARRAASLPRRWRSSQYSQRPRRATRNGRRSSPGPSSRLSAPNCPRRPGRRRASIPRRSGGGNSASPTIG